jgi:hypothetical protein
MNVIHETVVPIIIQYVRHEILRKWDTDLEIQKY